MMQVNLPMPPCYIPGAAAGATDLLPDTGLWLAAMITLGLAIWAVIWFVRRQQWQCENCATRFRVYPDDKIEHIRMHWNCPVCGGWVER